MEIDTAAWSGEGTFTRALIERLGEFEEIASVRVEDAASTRSDSDYNFISNEMFVVFFEPGRRRWWQAVLPGARKAEQGTMTLESLAAALGGLEGIGPADFVDDGMIQYLRTERITPPYQERGFKLVELVRIYRAGAGPA